MSKAKRTTCMLAFSAIGVAGALLVVLWPSILSEWYFGRLDHEDQAVRDEAAEAVGRLGQGKSVPRIRLADEDFRVCALAREALERIGE